MIHAREIRLTNKAGKEFIVLVNIDLVEVGGVKRNINIGMLDDIRIGDYVLIHVGFAMSKIDEKEAKETLRLLMELGSYEEEFEQYKTAVD